MMQYLTLNIKPWMATEWDPQQWLDYVCPGTQQQLSDKLAQAHESTDLYVRDGCRVSLPVGI